MKASKLLITAGLWCLFATGAWGQTEPDSDSTSSGPVGQAPEEQQPEVPEVFEERGALTADGSLIVEPAFEYSHSSANRVAIEAFTIVPSIAIGIIDVREVRRDTLIAALTFRYGLTNRLEMELRLPYVYREDEVRQRALLEPATGDTITDSDGSDIGDVEAALHYQFNSGIGGGPYFIGNLRAKSRTGTDPFEVDREFIRADDGTIIAERLTEQPTGSGFWSVQPSLTVIYPTDPAVLYGNVGYTLNLERDLGARFGRIDPGDFINFNFGMGFGINESTSFSLGYDHTVVLETDREAAGDIETEFDMLQVGTFLVGFSHRVSDETSLNLSLGVGVTEDSPDVQLSLRVPIRFL